MTLMPAGSTVTLFLSPSAWHLVACQLPMATLTCWIQASDWFSSGFKPTWLRLLIRLGSEEVILEPVGTDPGTAEALATAGHLGDL